MLRKDFLLSEIEKLTQVLAKILGLKNQGQNKESEDLLDSTLLTDFELNPEVLNTTSTKDFKLYLQNKHFGPQQLDILAQLLYQKVYLHGDFQQTTHLLHNVLLIFDMLEQEYHQQSLENINKRKIITDFLKSNR